MSEVEDEDGTMEFEIREKIEESKELDITVHTLLILLELEKFGELGG